MILSFVVSVSAIGALWAPDVSCNDDKFGAVHDMNHMFPGATQNIALHCVTGFAGISVEKSNLVLHCLTQRDCLSALSAYLSDEPDIDFVSAIKVAGETIGSPTVQCVTDADCAHPFAVCEPTSSIAGVGFCKPISEVNVAKKVCFSGLHASCEELYYGIGGFVAGIGLYVTTTYLFN